MIRKIWRAFTILLTIAALALVVVGLILPASVDVEITRDIDAPPAVVFDLVDDFDSYERWSLLAAEEGAGVLEKTGAFEGVGAKVAWRDVETGPRMGELEIVEARAPSYVRMAFPLEGARDPAFEFRIAPKDGGSQLTWSFTAGFGMDIVARYRGLSLQRWAQRDAQVGVENIKRLAEEG